MCIYTFRNISDSDSEEDRKRSFDESADLIKEGVIEYRACLRAWRRKNKMKIDSDKEAIRKEMEQKRLAKMQKKSGWNSNRHVQKKAPAATVSKNYEGISY